MPKVPVSVVVLAKSEERNIARCLRSLEWADEVVVVEDGSTDNTVTIARQNGARVIHNEFKSFASQRNWALQHGELRNDWVLMLDADEAATDAFASSVEHAIENAGTNTAAFRTCRKTMLLGQWLRRSDSFPVWIMRLVRRQGARFEDSGHGEVPVPDVQGDMDSIAEPFLHYPFSRGMDNWWERHIRYADREARYEIETTRNVSLKGLWSLDPSCRRRTMRGVARRLPLRGTLRFYFQYIFKGGFLDGIAGLHFCRMMACYERMIVIKKWELKQRTLGEIQGSTTVVPKSLEASISKPRQQDGAATTNHDSFVGRR